MKTIYFLMIFSIAMLSSCDEDSTELTPCEEKLLLGYDMVEYDGEEIGGQFFISAMDFEGATYYQLGSNRADVSIGPVDCNGDSFCAIQGVYRCEELMSNSTNCRIIGIKKE